MGIFLSSLFMILLGRSVTANAPTPWQMGFQEAATPVMEKIVDLHNYALMISVAICVLVLILLLVIVVRFRASKNPTPSKTTHNTVLEIIWTLAPVVVLVTIAIPSFRLLYFMDRTDNPDLTLKVTGHQWYWHYDYPQEKIAYDSYMVADKDLKPGDLRLLEVDNDVVVPVNANVRVLFASADVLHSWAVPAFGIKQDTIPGRLRETWFKVQKEGVYYGQCSELCGPNHGFMPIRVRVVSKDAYRAWLMEAKKKFAADGT